MNNRIHVLMADNDREFLEIRAQFLQRAGFTVHCAHTPQEARQLLASGRVHVALLDIRLVNDQDDQDTSGLTLAKDPRFAGIPKIMLTSYPSYQYVRDVLGPVVDGLPPAVAFLSKMEGPDAMIAAVEEAVQTYVVINWSLHFAWDALLSFMQLMQLLAPEQTPVQQVGWASELEELLRRLFYPCEQVTVGRLLRHEPGRVLLTATGFWPDGRHAPFVLAIGDRLRSQQEEVRYMELVPEAAKKNLHRWDVAQTVHFGAIAYTWHGDDFADLQTLGTALAQPSITAARSLLHHLYRQTLRPWYENGRSREPATRVRRFLQQRFSFPDNGQEWPAMAARLQDICAQALAANVQPMTLTETRLLFDDAQGQSLSLPHPMLALRQIQSAQSEQLLEAAAAHWGVVHGQVTPQAIWVTPRQSTAALDLSHAGHAPLLIDFVSLETAVKFELGLVQSPLLYRQVEQKLLAATHLNEPVADTDLPANGRTLLLLLQEIRYLAAELAGADMVSYRLGLFYYALATVQQFRAGQKVTPRALRPFVLALLSAAMLANELVGITAEDLPTEAKEGLWLDEDRQAVWVQGQRIDLTVQEYQIMAYLMDNVGQLCRREEIVVHALGEEYDDYQEDSRLNSAMSRLRQKIEPDSRQPRFLKTVRGSGYRLDL